MPSRPYTEEEKKSLLPSKKRHVDEKAYVLARLQSRQAVKPSVTTGYTLHKSHLKDKSTVDPPNTIYSAMAGASPITGINGTFFTPRAGIPRSEVDDPELQEKIEVKSHSHGRKGLEEDMRFFIGKDMTAAMEKSASGKVTVEWWVRELEGGMGAEVVDEDGTHVWWEIAEVQVVYEDPEGE
jgi:hypothetical protein